MVSALPPQVRWEYLPESMALDSPTSKVELEAALDELIQRAFNNGVPVGNGGYELTHEENSIPDWDLTIIRME